MNNAPNRIARTLVASVALAWGAAVSYGAVTTDGSIVGDGYGTPYAVQTVNTGFGDDDGVSKGSELDAAYAKIESGALHLALTGNLEDNFNKLVLFFDSVPGGVNFIDGFQNPVVDPSPFPSDPGMLQKLDGTTFDAGFNADYVMVLRHGFTGFENRFDVDFASLGPAGASSQYLGVFLPTFTFDWTGSGTTGTGAANPAPISVGLDNTNEFGVVGGSDPANGVDAAAVTTGVEIAMPLANLGSPTDSVKVLAYLTNSNHDYVSNQFLKGLDSFSFNLGSDSFGSFIPGTSYFDLNDFPGNQYFVVAVPEVSSFAFLGLVATIGSGAFWRRRRRTRSQV